MARPQSDDILTQLVAEYEQVNDNIRALADIRFKLLAFVPLLAGAGALLQSALLPADPRSPQSAVLALAGLVTTFGIIVYDQRNSELYNDLIDRAKFLERELKLPSRRQKSMPAGQFRERPGRGRAIGFEEPFRFTFGHDRALALIYGAALAAWVFPLVRFLIGLVVQPPLMSAWVGRPPEAVSKHPWAPPLAAWGPLLLTVAAFVLFWRVLVHLDEYPPGKPRWLAWWYCQTWLNGRNRRPLDKQLRKQLDKYVAASFWKKAQEQRQMFVDMPVSLADDRDLDVTLDGTGLITKTRVVGCFTTEIPVTSVVSKRIEVEAEVHVARWPSRKITGVEFGKCVKPMVAASTFCAWWGRVDKRSKQDRYNKRLGHLRGALQIIGTTAGIIHDTTGKGDFKLDYTWVGKEVDFAIHPQLLREHWSDYSAEALIRELAAVTKIPAHRPARQRRTLWRRTDRVDIDMEVFGAIPEDQVLATMDDVYGDWLRVAAHARRGYELLGRGFWWLDETSRATSYRPVATAVAPEELQIHLVSSCAHYDPRTEIVVFVFNFVRFGDPKADVSLRIRPPKTWVTPVQAWRQLDHAMQSRINASFRPDGELLKLPARDRPG